MGRRTDSQTDGCSSRARAHPGRARRVARRHADLSHISPLGWSEITVDRRGNVYVDTINLYFAEFNEVLTSGRAPGKIALVTPDGEARDVASELAFPNGMVITPDNKTLVIAESFAVRLTAFDIEDDGTLSNRRIWAEGVGPDGICLDADGCIWASTANIANDCARNREGGDVLGRIDLDRSCLASSIGPAPVAEAEIPGGGRVAVRR
jgi:sugar lactone lactonase YvrE